MPGPFEPGAVAGVDFDVDVTCTNCGHEAVLMNPEASWKCPSCETMNNEEAALSG